MGEWDGSEYDGTNGEKGGEMPEAGVSVGADNGEGDGDLAIATAEGKRASKQSKQSRPTKEAIESLKGPQ